MPDYIERTAAIHEMLSRYWGGKETLREIMNSIPAADVRPVVTCAECQHNNACLTQAFVDDCGKIPLDRNTFFCADGERRSNA